MHYCKFRSTIENVQSVSSRTQEDVVPTQNKLICSEEIDYAKLKVFSMKEFDELLQVRGTDDFLIINEFDLPQEKGDNKWNEFIEFKYVTSKGEHKVLIAPNTSLFIMSESGKTLDTVICY